jgi:hypothetical protein
MGVRTVSLGVERGTRASAALEAAESAWIAALPCAALTVLVVALLGPPLGHAFLAPGSEAFFGVVRVRPEPVEHGRYLLSLLGPLLLAAAVLASARRPPRLHDATARRVVLATQLALVAFLVLCLLAQHDVLLSAYRPEWRSPHVRYFTLPTLALAVALPALGLALLRRHGIAVRLAAAVRETRARRGAALAFAVLFTALWLLTAINTDGSVGHTAPLVLIHLPWSLSEPFAILDGRTPLVNFHAQYGQLWPYLAAGAMALLGASIGVYTVVAALCSGLALLAVFATLRRVVASSALALALYLPFVATGFFMKLGPLENRYGPAGLPSLWPVRYGGAYLLLWLLVRHVAGAAPRRVWVLFGIAGLVLINNPEFGVGAVAALAVALVAMRPPRSRAAAGRLLAEAAGGLAGAAVLVALGTLLRSGSLPHFGWALEFSRLYGIGGWEMLPMPAIGIYLAVDVTFVAAVAVAIVRAVRREANVALTAALLWSGVFGLLVGVYFAGRSHPQVLIDLFSPWALSIVLLTAVAVRALAARDWRAPTPAELAVLFGFGLTVCSLAQTPTPWSQVARLRHTTSAPVFRYREVAAFVREQTHRGEKVALLTLLGPRIAYETGRVDVSPYASMQSIVTVQQLARTIDALRRAGGRKLFISTDFTSPEQFAMLRRAGFVVQVQAPDAEGGRIGEFVDGAPRDG